MAARKSGIVATHWGNYQVETDGERVLAVRGVNADEAPSPIGQSLKDSCDERVRIRQPMVREGFLKDRRASDGRGRGVEKFIAVNWDTALDLAAKALAGIKAEHGNEAIFGGSYGWASAGRLHHAQSQIHRFLNLFGGYVSHRDTYSVGAGSVILPHVWGIGWRQAIAECVSCDEMVKHTELLVSFGGVAMKNSQVNGGGVGNHTAERQLHSLRSSGVRCVNISPLKEDMSDILDTQWISLRPNTDVAVMLGMAYVLYVEELYDREFIAQYTVGFDRFLSYLLGTSDGIAKDPEWAFAISGVPASAVAALAREMAQKRTLISASWSLQRAEHGEQAWWMPLVLASMLGYLGLPGCGINYGFGSIHNVGFLGRNRFNFRIGEFPQGDNPVATFIPVARISDMLLNPGGQIDYDGKTLTYPDIRAIVWAGGNPFHHHQDLNKLVRAWARPELVIASEIYWNAFARRADIVFPVTSPLERDDIVASSNDFWITPSHQVLNPFGQSRNDYDVYTGLAERLGFGDRFTEGRNSRDWLRHIYQVTVHNAADKGIELPDFDTFWEDGPICLADQIPPATYAIERFREDPRSDKLRTPSGKIEIFSEQIAGFGYYDCPGHPVWLEKREWLGSARVRQYPLHMISSQPKTRLHSQLDHGEISRRAKVRMREVLTLHRQQAERRGINEGDIVRVFNDRGSCLAAALLTEDIHPETIVLPTGAWFDPVDPALPGSMDTHGNPNVLTQDIGSSLLGQGCSAHSCLVEVERFTGELPPVRAFQPPHVEVLP
jgi:biotin/methionine sulfoxide reductase